MTHPGRSPGIVALALFFVFGTIMSGLAAVMLLFPGSLLEPLWRLNPRAREGFAAMGVVGCAPDGSGLCGLRLGGPLLVILAINLVGDTTNAVVAHDWHTLIGLPLGGVMIVYLLTRRGRLQSLTANRWLA